MEDENGNRLQFSYDGEGRLIKTADHSGREMRFFYGGDRLTGATGPTGETEGYTYGENGKLESIVKERNNPVVRNTYDRDKRIIRQEYADGGVQTYTYQDKKGSVLFTETDGSGTVYTHDRQLRHKRKGSGQTAESYTYTENGLVSVHTDRRGAMTCYTYGKNGRPESITKRDGSREEYLYDMVGRKTAYCQEDGGRTAYTYDREGRLENIRTPEGREWKAAYNDDGRISVLCLGRGGRKLLSL